MPDRGDVRFSRRNLDVYIHTHPVLREYRDHFVAVYGVERAYEHIMRPLFRTLRHLFHTEYENPYYQLFGHLADLSHEALMVASGIALAQVLRDDSYIRRNERELVHEIAGAYGYAMPSFPDHLDAIDRSRRLYAIYSAILAERWIPTVPRVADIFVREFGSGDVLPKLGFAELTVEQRLAIKSSLVRHGTDEVKEALDEIYEILPASPKVWDMEPVMQEIANAIIETYIERVEDDGFMNTIVERIRPTLEEYRDPRGKYFADLREHMPSFSEEMLERLLSKKHPVRLPAYLRSWIAAGEACGYPPVLPPNESF